MLGPGRLHSGHNLGSGHSAPQGRKRRAPFDLRASMGALWLVFVFAGAACGGGARSSGQLERVPDQRDQRRGALERVGQRLYRALAEGRPADLMMDDEALRALLLPEAATRARAHRASLGFRFDAVAPHLTRFREAEFAGLCLQSSRLEPGGGPVGLRADAWVFERALVVGTRPDGARLAAWVEGTFVFTDRGFSAIDLRRLERPRWEHSDLELSTCDMEVGLHEPLYVVGVTR